MHFLAHFCKMSKNRWKKGPKKCSTVPVWQRVGGSKAIWAMPIWMKTHFKKGFPWSGGFANYKFGHRSVSFASFHTRWKRRGIGWVRLVIRIFCKSLWSMVQNFCKLSYKMTKRNRVMSLRDGVKKSKWKFKMAFAMKGGGLEGVSSAIYLFWKMIFLKTI